MPTAPLLAFDTSTELLAVALHAAGRSWQVQAEGGARASATLLPQIEALLAQAGLAWRDLGHIAFGRGPGAFTGLRTACAVAQGLGLGLGLPLLPIDSLLIVAEDARLQYAASTPEGPEMDLGVAMDARMDEAYAGRYRWHAGDWQVLHAPALYTLPALEQAWRGFGLPSGLPSGPQWVAGTALDAFGARLVLPPGTRRCAPTQDRAQALLRLALRAAAAGLAVDAAAALPLYLRDKVAQTTAEREALRAAAATAATAP
jgi:tRNA threonylcarbamoyladenosine biosynthesis protein TsaB